MYIYMYMPRIILILQNLITNIFHFFINNLEANFKTLNCNCNVTIVKSYRIGFQSSFIIYTTM